MHTQNWDKEILYSLPIEVVFAGFRGDTLSLARSGWDLSMRQGINHTHYGEYELQLAMRHSGAQLYALSNPIAIDRGRLRSALENRVSYAQLLTEFPFFIQYVSSDFRFQVMPIRGVQSFASQFNAIDPYPQERIIEESIKDFKFFKVANPTLKDIIVTSEQVPEMLDLILKAQKPVMDEIRKRERSRENLEKMREGFNTKPAHQVQAQIITLAG